MPESVASHDSLNDHPAFIVYEDSQVLIQRFVEELEKRQALIVEEVERLYRKPEDFPIKTQEA